MDREAGLLPVPKPRMPGGGQPPQKKFKNANGNAQRRQLHSTDIVYTKGTTIQTVPSLTKMLKGVTEPIIGLQYVWEYRSPSKSVPPHYQCKLCSVSRIQHDMLAHIKGWKHSLRYLMRAHADMVCCDEEEATKDHTVRKKIKEITAEVEKKEGRGRLRAILKEPCDVPAFQGLRTAIPKPPQPMGPGMGSMGPKPGGRFSDPIFPGEYPRHGGPFSEPPMRGPGDLGTGGYSSPLVNSRPSQGFPGPDMGQRRFSDGGLGGGRDGFGSGGLLGEGPGRRYGDDFRGGSAGGGPSDRPGLMGAAPDSGSSLPATLLKYLDTFRIENENDAQIVLKVTQKLTDVLMDYRLRSVSSGSLSSSMNNSSLSSMGYSSPPSRMPSSGDRYSGSLSGPSRYSDGPSRFYN